MEDHCLFRNCKEAPKWRMEKDTGMELYSAMGPMCDTHYKSTRTLPEGFHIDYRGHRFTPPFQCLCCGMLISARQFAWGRTCGYCDTGRCEKSLNVFEEGHSRINGWKRIFDAPLIVPKEPNENLAGLEMVQRMRRMRE